MGTPPNIPLNDLHTIPQVGFGVFGVPPEETIAAVEHATFVGA